MMLNKGRCKVLHLRIESCISEGSLGPTDLERSLAARPVRDLVDTESKGRLMMS